MKIEIFNDVPTQTVYKKWSFITIGIIKHPMPKILTELHEEGSNFIILFYSEHTHFVSKVLI